jgi:hypothetical protein
MSNRHALNYFSCPCGHIKLYARQDEPPLKVCGICKCRVRLVFEAQEQVVPIREAPVAMSFGMFRNQTPPRG